MKNTEIKIHGLRPHDRGAKVRWLLAELDVDYKSSWMDSKKKEHESPQYLKLNPMGRVPFAEIGEASLFESGAICAYLADLYLDKGLAPQLSMASDRAKYQQWMYFASATLDTIQARIMIIEDIPTGELRTEKENALLEHVRDSVTALDIALTKNSYLVGDHFTAADICVGYHLYFLTLWPELAVIIQEFPKVISYLNRLKERAAAIKSDALNYKD